MCQQLPPTDEVLATSVCPACKQCWPAVQRSQFTLEPELPHRTAAHLLRRGQVARRRRRVPQQLVAPLPQRFLHGGRAHGRQYCWLN